MADKVEFLDEELVLEELASEMRDWADSLDIDLSINHGLQDDIAELEADLQDAEKQLDDLEKENLFLEGRVSKLENDLIEARGQMAKDEGG
jgi:predicted  nucleic acid-binding Zn-ribbon protein